MNAPDPAILARLTAINAACQGLSGRDKAGVLAMAYLIAATEARSEALIEPGGYQAEQEIQLADLETITALIREDSPDLELERLQLENDVAGTLRYLEQRRAELERSQPPDE